MATEQLMYEWNKSDEKGSIQPPLSHEEVDALSAVGIGPDNLMKYKQFCDVARVAFIMCDEFRVKPSSKYSLETTARVTAENMVKAFA